MSRINADWHTKHPMPKNASMDERIRWHVAHARTCGCREIPKTVLAEMERRGMPIPDRRTA